MDVSGKMRLYRKDFENNTAYSTSITNKDANGMIKRLYVSVQLPKGVTLSDKTDINCKRGFLSFFEDKKGYQKIKIIVMEFEEYDTPADVTEEIMSMDSDELPF